MTEEQLREVMLLNLRCFERGENYTKHTFKYLLTEPQVLSYRAVEESGRMVGFIFVIATAENIAHITTIGVAPEHRKRGIARMMLEHTERSLKNKGFGSIVLEVRVSNENARKLYSGSGYVVTQRLIEYYNDGEDAFLMSKVLR
ncbi:MAG: ribosomal-protein-alanine N-acetyltransferase [Acidobacteria bacterium]|nr:MAG: ribosomal-protein-alanine N-acetyltransferase [Acidobacteriota bacterium]REK43716.1 MAG: ribosomal-protein-alanine N-acetyltransferase [Acidobacteriota bacterium]